MPKVFLGGTCGGSRWRDKMIPLLKLDYFNPAIATPWNEAARERELLERESADFLLYVITPRTAGCYSIAEAVDDSNKRPAKTIFTILPYDVDDNLEWATDGPHYSHHQLELLRAVGRLVASNGATSCDWAAAIERLNAAAESEESAGA